MCFGSWLQVKKIFWVIKICRSSSVIRCYVKFVAWFEKLLCLPADSNWWNTNIKINVRFHSSGIGFVEWYLNCLQRFVVPANHEKLGLRFPLKIFVFRTLYSVSLGNSALLKADPYKLRMDQMPSVCWEPGKRKSDCLRVENGERVRGRKKQKCKQCEKESGHKPDAWTRK